MANCMKNRQSVRLQEYDYTQSGWYFLTIVAHQRICLFGTITDREITLNNLGTIVLKEWERLSQRFAYVTRRTYHYAKSSTWDHRYSRQTKHE